MKNLKYLQMWFSQMFQRRKNKPTQTLLLGSCDCTGETPEARRENSKVVHAAQRVPGAGDWLHNASCSSTGAYGHGKGVQHLAQLGCPPVPVYSGVGAAPSQGCSHPSLGPQWLSLIQQWVSLNLLQKALTLVEPKLRETQISTGLSTKLCLLLYQVILFFLQSFPRHFTQKYWRCHLLLSFPNASFLQTNPLSGTNQVCSLLYRTWKCYQHHQHHTEIQTDISSER